MATTIRAMIDRIPRRLRFAFSRPGSPAEPPSDEAAPDGREEVDFVAYGEDCILFGRTRLEGDRLSDMLNAHDEYALFGVSVERFDGGPPLEVADVVVPRDELWLVHATGPRGPVARRHRTSQQHVAIKMGPFSVRGFYHALPGADPVASIRRRKTMVPLTGVRIGYTIGTEKREVRVDTVIVNRNQIDWMEAIEPDRADFPVAPRKMAVDKP
jgi:hypothetical protein